MSEEQRAYSNGEITVHWDASKCTHSGNCVRGLPQVFDIRKRPWITITGASTAEIEAQVARCPSGALRITRDE
ncbi:MAG TPA: (4Fe-4S)-binding protein [Fimbriimonadaceae bacterium]|nr:(4Fe-4S)-binding protein [Fimbriimonadaceae bacterium]HRJ32848.1 (4Fe-4S)-binding protein [Fimbriimonadaceae bacterium]